MLSSTPIEFTEYANIKQERIIITIATSLSMEFVGTMSPKPIVVIVVMTQKIEAMYLSAPEALYIEMARIQECLSVGPGLLL